MAAESRRSAFCSMISITSSATMGAALPVLGLTYVYKARIVSLNDLVVFLCKLLTATRAANWA